MVVGRGGRPPQALIRIGEARVFLGLEVSLVLRRFARFLLARQIRGECRELLLTGLPQCAQLEEHQRAEPGLWIAEQIAERIQLFLHADGRAFLLLELVAQQVKFVLQVGVGFLETRAILEQLHEPLFLGTHCAALGTAFEKTQLVDQSPASAHDENCGTRRRRQAQALRLKAMSPLGTIFQPFI